MNDINVHLKIYVVYSFNVIHFTICEEYNGKMPFRI
jgi:hypothetical protein